jgi:hypothetical protein
MTSRWRAIFGGSTKCAACAVVLWACTTNNTTNTTIIEPRGADAATAADGGTVDSTLDSSDAGVDASGDAVLAVADSSIADAMGDANPADVTLASDAADSSSPDAHGDASLAADVPDAAELDAAGADAADAYDGGLNLQAGCGNAGNDAQSCSCIHIASIGAHGGSGSAADASDMNSWADWLNTESNASVDTFLTKPALVYDPTNTADASNPSELLLNRYDVVVLQWLADVPCVGSMCTASSYWQFSADEQSALAAWVNDGGGIVALSGYDQNSAEVTPINSLLSFTEMQFGTDDVFGNCQLFDGGPDSLCYCNNMAAPVGPPWASTPIGANVTQVGAFHGRPVATSGVDAVVDVQDKQYVYAAHETIGKGHVFVFTDDWVTYANQWLVVGGNAGGGVDYDNPQDPCYQRASGKLFQVPQFWYNVIAFETSGANCAFSLAETPQQPPIVESDR